MKTNAAALAEQARAKVRHRALARHRDKIVTQAKSADEIDKIKYQDQGNEELNTEEAFEARAKIRHHSLVLDALNEWWAVVQKSAVAQGYSVSEMCQQQYMQIYHLLYYDLLGKEDYDEKEADSEGLEEWTKDSGGAGTMERGAFLDALFEVCDVYTETMNPQDYSDWLRALLRRLLGPNGCFMLAPPGYKSWADRKAAEEEAARKKAEGKDGKGKGGKDGKGGKKGKGDGKSGGGGGSGSGDGLSDEERARRAAMSPEELEAYLKLLAGMSKEQKDAWGSMTDKQRNQQWKGEWKAGRWLESCLE